jgi:hypothetical protein
MTAISYFIWENYDGCFEYRVNYYPMCVKDIPLDVEGMFVFYSNLCLHLTTIPFLLKMRFKVMAVFEVSLVIITILCQMKSNEWNCLEYEWEH